MRADLKGFRDLHTDDGEEWWVVGVFDALSAVVGEMESWPKVRLLVPATGEVFVAPLRHLVQRIGENLSEGRMVKVEPADE